jgi:O-antigen/teichoic acid export membrane protein
MILTTLIRLMGAWIAVYGLLFGTHFLYMLKHEASGMHIFLAFLPSLVSLVIGSAYIIWAPKIAGGREDDLKGLPDILPAGLILLGVYWLGSGFFQGVGNMNFYRQIFDSSRFDLFSDSAFWVALGNFAQAFGGLVLIIIGNRMRSKTQAEQAAP